MAWHTQNDDVATEHKKRYALRFSLRSASVCCLCALSPHPALRMPCHRPHAPPPPFARRRDATPPLVDTDCRPRRAPIASHSKRLLALVCLRRPGRPLRRVVRRGSQRPRTRSTRRSKARSLSTAASSLGLSSRGSPHWLVCRLEPPPPRLDAHHCPHMAVVSAKCRQTARASSTGRGALRL